MTLSALKPCRRLRIGEARPAHPCLSPGDARRKVTVAVMAVMDD